MTDICIFRVLEHPWQVFSFLPPSRKDMPMNTQQNLQTQIKTQNSNRISILKFLLIVFPMWLSAKMYSGPYMEHVRNYLAAIIVVILLALLLQLIFSEMKEKPILFSLFVFLSLIEIIHRLIPAIFSAIHFSIGTAPIIGGAYSIHMIPYYGVGGFIGFFVLKACKNK